MHVCSRFRLRNILQFATSFAAVALVLASVVLTCSQPANALPAFARKYGLRCSACHESWPMLNYFGQKFKDNGYQIMNDRDAPIWQNPGYWPVTFRITPIWHRVSTGKVPIDIYASDGAGGTFNTGPQIQRVTSSGFDLSGLDFHTGGTLEKNISFYVLPSSDSTASFHFETVMARFDNLFGSPWLNVKMGKFELDNLLSEKRILTLTGNGGIYQLYHFVPVGDGNVFGQMGDNQLGARGDGTLLERSNALLRGPAQLGRWSGGLALWQCLYRILYRQSGLRYRQAWSPAHRLLRHGWPSANYLAYLRWHPPRHRSNRQQVLQPRGLRRAVLLRPASRSAGCNSAWPGQRLVWTGLWRSA